MSILTLKILDDRDEEFVMTILNALTQRQIIEVSTKDSYLLPWEPVTVEQLNARIEKAERTPRVSIEEARTRLGI